MMYLCEEYMFRHNIKIPYAKLVEFGASFLKLDEGPWNILTILWKEPTRHPGNYVIKIIQPRHNGYETGRLFETNLENSIYLDEYEKYFFNFASKFNGKIARGEEITIAAWETYLYCYDSLLVRHAHMEELLATIDQSLSFSKRLMAIEETVLKLSDLHPRVIESWSVNMLKYIDQHNDWLPVLVDYMHDPSNNN